MVYVSLCLPNSNVIAVALGCCTLSTFLFPIKILMPHLRWLDKPADLRERLNVTRRSKEAEKEEKPKAMDKMKIKEGQNIF